MGGGRRRRVLFKRGGEREGFVGFSRIFQGEKEGRKEDLWEGGGEEVMISVWNFVQLDRNDGRRGMFQLSWYESEKYLVWDFC